MSSLNNMRVTKPWEGFKKKKSLKVGLLAEPSLSPPFDLVSPFRSFYSFVAFLTLLFAVFPYPVSQLSPHPTYPITLLNLHLPPIPLPSLPLHYV